MDGIRVFPYDHDPSSAPPAPPRQECQASPSTPPPLQIPMLNSTSLSLANLIEVKPPLFPHDEASGDMANSKGLKNALLGYLVSGR